MLQISPRFFCIYYDCYLKQNIFFKAKTVLYLIFFYKYFFAKMIVV